ncbi:unnamed protein product [Microthlaspi erraticum]|uniref:Uncharacterized protein n=1 Tax=Microthlaspi erraticum TaxID=1685480 RepID=A0A6D2KTE6_9BRAS|nr:unnamed protein product [Microthlaspi erraticum]
MPEKVNRSPRISFSQDFCHSESIPIEQSPLRPPSESSSHHSGFKFDLSIPGGVITGESSCSAEELFYDGKILPTEIKKSPEPEKEDTGSIKPETNPIGDIKPVVEIEETGEAKTVTKSFSVSSSGRPKPETNPIRDVKPVHEIEEIEGEEDKISTIKEKPKKKKRAVLWFDRSSSLPYEARLPLLSKNSTGSNSKPTETMELEVSSSSSKCSLQKQPLKKKDNGGYSYGGNGGEIRVSSCLDVIPSGNFFGLGSIVFGSGSDKNKKRSMIFCW